MQANGAAPAGRVGVTAHRSRLTADRLGIGSSDAATAAGFARACARALALARATKPPLAETAAPALAALALGDPAPAAALLDAWAAGRAEAETLFGVGGTVSLPLLAARHLGWTGDAALARRVWPRARELAARARQVAQAPDAEPGRVAIVAGLLRELGPIAEAAGDPASAGTLAAEARSLLRQARAATPEPPAPEYFVAAALGAFDPDPPLGDAATAVSAEFSISLLDAVFRSVQAWAGMAAGQVEAVPRWQHLLAWIDQESARTADVPAEGADVIGAAAALAVAAGVFGLLGASPDAPRLRLRLRPHLPEAWQTLEMRNLAMADGRFDLRIRRQDGRRSYVVEQTAGAVPATVILEMIVPGPTVRSIDVDGRPATLDIRPFGPAFLIPVQLVTDEVRVVTVTGAGY